MKKYNILFLSLLFLFFSMNAYSQPVFQADQSNFEEIVEEIFEIYGSQIDLTFDEVRSYIQGLVANVDAEACKDPYPSIADLTQDKITFKWNSVDNAILYQTGFLNLNSGEQESVETTDNSITFDNLSGLILFPFNTLCEEGITSKVDIIIVDVDLFFPGDPPPQGEELCLCQDPASLPIYNGSSPTTVNIPVPWPGHCDNNKYKLLVKGNIPGSNYLSEITFIHDQLSSPNSIFLMSKCDENALSVTNPPFAGSPGYYSASFTTNNLVLSIPPSDLTISDMVLNFCGCVRRGDGGKRSSRYTEIVLSNSFTLYPNPATDLVQVNYELERDSPITIEVYDVLGKKIKTIYQNNTQSAGQYQIDLDVQSWPSGMYTFRWSSLDQNQQLLFSKE